MADQTQGVVAHLVLDDASAAIAFYTKAFGATEVMRMPANDGKRLLHAQIIVNGAQIYLMDYFRNTRRSTATTISRRPKPLADRASRCISKFRIATMR